MIEIIILIIVFLSAALAADYYAKWSTYKLQKELEETRQMLEHLSRLSGVTPELQKKLQKEREKAWKK